MTKRVKLLHNLDELEDNEEIELHLEDQPILENNRINEQEDVLFNKDIKRKFQRKFYKKQLMFEDVND